MKLLLDTHILLWAALYTGTESNRLSRTAAELIFDKTNALLFSSASLWEIAIKFRSGRSDFGLNPRVLHRNLLDNDYTELPVVSAHALHVARLPNIHKDPFDRLLVAQATVEGFTLLTADARVAAYPGPIRKV